MSLYLTCKIGQIFSFVMPVFLCAEQAYCKDNWYGVPTTGPTPLDEDVSFKQENPTPRILLLTPSWTWMRVILMTKSGPM
jgi:hypothetical protein